jgi:hypothetical protein
LRNETYIVTDAPRDGDEFAGHAPTVYDKAGGVGLPDGIGVRITGKYGPGAACVAGVNGWHAASGKDIRAATIPIIASAALRFVSGDEKRHTVFPLAKNSAVAPENMRGDISQELCLRLSP